jgi:hypothetical protein
MKTHSLAVSLALIGVATALSSLGAQYTSTILPSATGTIAFFPEFGLWGTPVGDDIQSTFFRTTPVNREFRRGFLEFVIPREFVLSRSGGTIVSATLLLSDECGGCGWISFPTPPDAHEIGCYAADLVVETNDYHVGTMPVATFETDANVFPENFSIDVREVVEQFRGGNVGFRIKLAVDPEYFGEGHLGSGFANNNSGSPARIVITSSYPALNTVEVRTVRPVALEPRKHGRAVDGLFVISRTGITNQSVRVGLALEGTARNGIDYMTISNFVILGPGQVSVQIPVRALADAEAERIETVTLRLLRSSTVGDYDLGERTHASVVVLDAPRSEKLQALKWSRLRYE